MPGSKSNGAVTRHAAVTRDMRDRCVTVTPQSVTECVAVTPQSDEAQRVSQIAVTPQNKIENKIEKEDIPPHLRVDPHLGRDTPSDGGMSFEDAQKWLNSLFPKRERKHWGYEEKRLLSELLPIPKDDRALLSWAYKLPCDKAGWAIAQDKQQSKPKQSLIALLREFYSELDKWRSVRRNLSGVAFATPDVPLPPEWIAAGVRIFGPYWDPPPNMRLLSKSDEQDIKQELEREKHESAAA